MTANPAGGSVAPMSEAAETLQADEIKSCCANLYSSDVVRALLGDSYHPGGLALTRDLLRLAGVTANNRVLDVASGTGATAFLIASELGAEVTGVDLSVENVSTASAEAADRGVSERVQFRSGDAEALPVEDNSFDVVVCECAFCTFPNKTTAAAELARALKPGGRLALSDVVLDFDAVGPGLRSLAGWIACLADAKPLETYSALLSEAGLSTTATVRCDDAIASMLDLIESRMTALRMLGALPQDVDWSMAPVLLEEARSALAAGSLGYALLIAEKPK